ncbi:MAG: biotin--[acetyl-CoA-carboxylase] ligase [Bacteroidales bacterium]|nr:biotin--[acetyl-CoA-carboxylase] ligase [Bacteroidales bacterium]MCD8393989.1 biotin--[acetyl-CoA-carboxylase] ligase [Bacteroidales bacterium]
MLPPVNWLPETPSTNSALRSLIAQEPLEPWTVVATLRQTAGRGQRGNTWESEPGKNASFSLLIRPHELKASEQWTLSLWVSIGTREALSSLVPDPSRLRMKWPNDVYYDDRKLGGILIENSLRGEFIDWSIAGIGINVNQTRFLSDAPNPVSLAQILDQDNLEIEPIIAAIQGAIAETSRLDYDTLASRYHSILWRNDGLPHSFVTPDGTRFDATISHVLPTGHISLQPTSGPPLTFAFKEVTPLL